MSLNTAHRQRSPSTDFVIYDANNEVRVSNNNESNEVTVRLGNSVVDAITGRIATHLVQTRRSHATHAHVAVCARSGRP